MVDNMANRVYEVIVDEVHSGDDLILMVNLGIDGLYKKVRARLFGVDTPNAYKAKPDTDAGRLREEVRQLTVNRKCYAEVVSYGKGGWLINLFVGGPAIEDYYSLNESLCSRGYLYKGNSQSQG